MGWDRSAVDVQVLEWLELLHLDYDMVMSGTWQSSLKVGGESVIAWVVATAFFGPGLLPEPGKADLLSWASSRDEHHRLYAVQAPSFLPGL